MRSREEIERSHTLSAVLALEVALDVRDLILQQQTKVAESDVKVLKAEVKAEVDKLNTRIEFLEGGFKRIIETIRDERDGDPESRTGIAVESVIYDIAQHALNPTAAYIPAVLLLKHQQKQFEEASIDPEVLKARV